MKSIVTSLVDPSGAADYGPDAHVEIWSELPVGITGGVATDRRLRVDITATGLSTPPIRAGNYQIRIKLSANREALGPYPFTMPDGDGTTELWPLIAAAVNIPPDTPVQKIQEALAAYLIANPIDGNGLDQTAVDARIETVGDARYAPLWQPSTAYAINAPVLLPNGKIGTRTAAGTSRATFDATEEATWTVVAGGSGISQSAADARYSQSVYLRDYVSDSNTPAQNRTAYLAAIAAAAAGSKRLCYDGAYFTYAGATVTDTNAGMVHWASSWDTHVIRQGTKGYGGLTLAGAGSLAENLNTDGLNDTMDFTGVTIGGAQTFRHSTGVRLDPTAHGSTLRNIRGKGFMHVTVAASLTAEEVTSGGTIGTRLRDCLIDGVYSDNCWTALQYIAVQKLQIRKLRGTYSDVIGSGGEPHLIYGAGYNSEPSYDVTLDDCNAWGGKQHGVTDSAAAYKLTNTIGLTFGNLRAQDCPGLLSIEKCQDFTMGTGVIGVRDTTTGSAPMVQFADCARGTVAPFVAKSTAQLTNGSVSARITRCINVDFDTPRITVAPPASPGTAYILNVSGNCAGTRVRTPELTADTVAITFGMLIEGAGDPSSNVEIDDPRVTGAITNGIRVNVKDTTVRYRSARVAGTTRRVQIDSTATPVKVINLDNTARIDTHPRVLGWHYGEDPSSSERVTVWPSGQQRLYKFGNAWAGNWAGRITEPENGGRRMFCAAFAADVDLSVDVRLSGGVRAGLCLRAVSDSTFITVSRASGSVKIHRISAGALTELATGAVGVPNGAFANLRAIVVGSVIQVLLNGVQVIEPYTLTGGDETTFVSTAHGLYGDTAAASAWENVRVLGVA